MKNSSRSLSSPLSTPLVSVQSWIEIFFIGPKLVWQTTKMSIASARVITQRSRLIATGPRSSSERREYPRMVQEKIHGGREAAEASLQSLITAGPTMINTVFAKFFDVAKDSLALITNRKPAACIKLAAQWVRSTTAFVLVIPIQIYVFLAALIFSAAAPLDKRVSANAKRLKVRRKSRQ